MVKLETVGLREHFDKEFRLRESFELCRNVGKNFLFVVEVYLIDEERKEGEGRMRASWDLETPLEKRSPGEE